jgi:hypothetical protein
MLRRVVWSILTDVSEKRTAFIIGVVALLMENVRFSETSVSMYEATRCNIPEVRHLQKRLPFCLRHVGPCTLVELAVVSEVIGVGAMTEAASSYSPQNDPPNVCGEWEENVLYSQVDTDNRRSFLSTSFVP